MSIEQQLGFRFPFYWSGAAIEEQFARLLISKIVANKPQNIIELGCGLSTLITIKTLHLLNYDYNFYSLEGDETSVNEIIELLKSENIFDKDRQHMQYAPIKDIDINGKKYKYYDPAQFVFSFEKAHLVTIDGPVGASCHHARYPAFPLLRKYVGEGSIVLLDDAARKDEKEIIELWKKENNDIQKVWYHDTNRGAVEIRL